MTPNRRYRVFVVELSDGFGPRRRDDLPNLYVGVTALDPDEKFRRTKAGGRGPRSVREYGVALRPDLAPEPGPFTLAEANHRRDELARRYAREGYAVTGRDRNVYRVYVIELSDEVGPRKDASLPWVYVGQTALTPEERFEIHRTQARSGKGGPLASRVVAKHFIGLRPDLYADEPPRYTRNDAVAAEAELGERLRSLGYSVKGAH